MMAIRDKKKLMAGQIFLIIKEIFSFCSPTATAKFKKRLFEDFEKLNFRNIINAVVGNLLESIEEQEFRKALENWYRKRIGRDFKILNKWLAGKRILDYGSGRGYLGLEIHRKTKREVVLADIEDRNVTCLPFYLIGEGKTSFKSGQFDTVLIVNVLHHSQSPEKIIKETVRISRGRIVIFEHHLYNPQKSCGLTKEDWELLFCLSEEIFYCWGKKRRPRLNFQNYQALKKMFKRFHLNLIYEKFIPFPNKDIFILGGWLFVLEKRNVI